MMRRGFGAGVGGAIAGLAMAASALSTSGHSRGLRMPSLTSGLVLMPSAASAASDGGVNEVALLGTAAAFGLAVLVDAGGAPVNSTLEPELTNFADGDEATVLEALAFVLLRGYKRAISPNLPKNCRFVPTCSEYAALAISEFGVVRGGVLAAWRVARCNPIGGKGYDPPQWPPPSFGAPEL